MSDSIQPIVIATREQIKEFMGEKPMEVKLDDETSISCPDPESLFVASIKVMMNKESMVSYNDNKLIVIGEDATEFSEKDYKAFFGENALSDDNEKQQTFKCAMINSIRGFYGIEMNKLKEIAQSKGENLNDEDKKIFDLFDKCSRVINGEELNKVLENEHNEKVNTEKQPKKTNFEINQELKPEEITEDIERAAYKGSDKEDSRQNLDCEKISFEELDFRLRDCTKGRGFDDVMASIQKALSDTKNKKKIRLNDALFGTGQFGGEGAKKVRRVNKLHEWLLGLTKTRTEYSSMDPNSKLESDQRINNTIDRARGLFDACLRRMMLLAPEAFKAVGINGIKKGKYFNRNLKRTRRFGHWWIRGTFDVDPGVKSTYGVVFSNPTKRTFFSAISKVYQESRIKEFLKYDKPKIVYTGIDSFTKEKQFKSKDVDYKEVAKSKFNFNPNNSINENSENLIKANAKMIELKESEISSLTETNSQLTTNLSEGKTKIREQGETIEKQKTKIKDQKTTIKSLNIKNQQLQEELSKLQKLLTKAKVVVKDEKLQQSNEQNSSQTDALLSESEGSKKEGTPKPIVKHNKGKSGASASSAQLSTDLAGATDELIAGQKGKGGEGLGNDK